MLSELAISPAIFRASSYASNEVADLCLRTLKAPLLEDCVVRDLHEGDWFQQLMEQRDSLHPKAKELLKKLKSQERLVQHGSIGDVCPGSDEQWENEALASHDPNLSGMIFSEDSKQCRHRKNPLVACPERLSSAIFWQNRPCSLRIPRSIEAYGGILQPLIRHANCLAFIDPHLNPGEKRYKDFISLLTHVNLTGRGIRPTIEIHRVAWLGKGADKTPRLDDIKKIFHENWSGVLEQSRVGIDVFLWDDFHDRFVASDLLGMSWSNGFDTIADSKARVTVTRLSRSDRDDVQLEFASNSNRHQPMGQFRIGP